MGSTSGEYIEDRSSLLSLQPWVFRKESCGYDDDSIGISGEFSGRLDGVEDGAQADMFSPRSIRVGCGSSRGRSSLRSRRGRKYSVRTLGSNVGNCLIPKLYDQQFEIEEYVFSSPPSQTERTMRPCVVTDGKRIISKSSYGPVHVNDGLGKKVHGDALGALGVPCLPVRTPKRKSRDARCEGLDTSASRRYCNLSHSQGSPDRMLLFALGISIGVISTVLSNRREVDKLNYMLKHTENLVQDLQDELDMKESLTVKELVNEACESQELQGSYANLKEATDHTEGCDHRCDQPHLPKAVENSDSMSKIEAELEAELERLGLNMNSSCLDGEVSALNELDSDLIGDVVHGELRANMFDSGIQECQADPDRNSRGTSTADTYDPNYAVSPRELSLRLHELIQHRLEEQIKELETELQHSQKQLQFVQTEGVISEGSFSNSDVESTSHESPIVMERESASVQPLCFNLSGNALNAYEEAYEEFVRMTDTEGTLPTTTDTKKNLYGDGIFSTNRGLIWGMEGDDINKPSAGVEYIEGEQTWKQILSSSKGFDDVDESNGGDEYEIDDEEGKMIQQIVERTRQGSPVVLNAQKLFFSMDE